MDQQPKESIDAAAVGRYRPTERLLEWAWRFW